MHPILDSLDNTEYDWIKKLLFTFNEGNIGKFESLAPLFPKEVSNQFISSLNTCLIISPQIAHLARELPLPKTKDLFNGSHRIRVQASR